MDPNFLPWMICQYEPRTAKNSYDNMKSLFADENLKLDEMSDFADSDEMIKFVWRVIRDRSPVALGGILCDKRCADMSNMSDKVAGTTVYNQCRAFVHYLEFLGFKHVELDMLVRKIGGRSANFQQGSILEKIFDPIPQIYVMNMITKFIHRMQEEANMYMKTIINLYQNDQNNAGDFGKVGVKFFLPFLELLIRFYVYPTEISHIKGIRAWKDPKKWTEKLTNATNWSNDKRNGTFQFVQIEGKILVKWHYYIIGASRPKTYLPSYRFIDETVSQYIFFYMKYCSDIEGKRRTSGRNKTSRNEDNICRLVFPSAGYIDSWKRPVQDVTHFCRQNEMGEKIIKAIGLATNRYSYISRLMKVSIEANQDTSITIRNIYQLGLSMAVHKTSGRYGGIQHLEDIDSVAKEIEKFHIDHSTLIHKMYELPASLANTITADMMAEMFADISPYVE